MKIGEAEVSDIWLQNFIWQRLWKASRSLNTHQEHDEVSKIVVDALQYLSDYPEHYTAIAKDDHSNETCPHCQEVT